jgi:hypothetical protein
VIAILDRVRQTRVMDGFVRGIGEAISGVMVAFLSAVGGAIDGALHALETAVPGGALPVIGLVILGVVVLKVFRR